MHYGIKVQVVRDLMKSLNRRAELFIKKKHAEQRKVKQQAAIRTALDSTMASKQTIWSSK